MAQRGYALDAGTLWLCVQVSKPFQQWKMLDARLVVIGHIFDVFEVVMHSYLL